MKWQWHRKFFLGGAQPRKNLKAKQEVVETMAEFVVNENSEKIQAGTSKAPMMEIRFRWHGTERWYNPIFCNHRQWGREGNAQQESTSIRLKGKNEGETLVKTKTKTLVLSRGMMLKKISSSPATVPIDYKAPQKKPSTISTATWVVC